MFTCTFCFGVYLEDSSYSVYTCQNWHRKINGRFVRFCQTAICKNCEPNIVKICHELINIEEITFEWIELQFNWLCSYKCMLEYTTYSNTFDLCKLSKDSMPYLQHIEAEKEIFNRQVCEKLVNEAYFLKELAQVVIEYLN